MATGMLSPAAPIPFPNVPSFNMARPSFQKVKNCKFVNGGKKQAFSCGTFFRLEWGSANDKWPFDPTVNLDFWVSQLWRLIAGFALFNPHLSISFDWFGKRKTWEATDPKWTKSRPSDPTSPHWYAEAN